MEYQFNAHNVCINPKIAYQYHKDCHTHACLEVACRNGKWFYGYSLNYHTGGGGSPCCQSHFHDDYDTEQQAISNGMDRLASYIRGDIEWNQNCGRISQAKQLQAMLDDLQQHQNASRQMSIFDLPNV